MKYSFNFETTEKETGLLVGAMQHLTSALTMLVAQSKPDVTYTSFRTASGSRVPSPECPGCDECMGEGSDDDWPDDCDVKDQWYATDANDGPDVDDVSVKSTPAAPPATPAPAEPPAPAPAPAASEAPPEYITIKVDNGAAPSEYGEQPIITIRKPSLDDVKKGMLLFSQFLRNFTLFWDTGEGTAGAKKMLTQRQVCMLELVAGPILLPVKQYFLRCGSMNRAVFYVLASWDKDVYAARFVMDQGLFSLREYANRIATLIVQMCHACAPELVYFFDHSSGWRRDLTKADNVTVDIPLDLQGVLIGQGPADMELTISRMTWPDNINEDGTLVGDDQAAFQHDTNDRSQ